MSVSKKMEKQIIAFSCNEILLSNEKKWTTYTRSDMNESQNHDAEQRKQDLKSMLYILRGSEWAPQEVPFSSWFWAERSQGPGGPRRTCNLRHNCLKEFQIEDLPQERRYDNCSYPGGDPSKEWVWSFFCPERFSSGLICMPLKAAPEPWPVWLSS